MAKKGMTLPAGRFAPIGMPGRVKRVGDRSAFGRKDMNSSLSDGVTIANAMRAGMRSGDYRTPVIDERMGG
jgi:hypothetical protein